MSEANNNIILYHYSFSPYARRVIWYLALRGIDYAECKQAPVLPRPDIKALGVNYRRIPILAIGRDIYCDTRIILRKLEEFFPDKTLGSNDPDSRAIQKFLEIWAVESGLFNRASQLIPSDMPLLNDPKFVKDREDLTSRPWSKEGIDKNRPEALAAIRSGFSLLETTLLADGREWVLKTDRPTLADIEAIWVFDWLDGLKGALPRELISEKQYPRVFAWIKRFNAVLRDAKSRAPKPTSLKGDVAAQRILKAPFRETDLTVDHTDPLGLQPGTQVVVYPTDSGSRHQDQGTLIGLSENEIVLSVESQGQELHVHYPRTGFRIQANNTSGNARL